MLITPEVSVVQKSRVSLLSCDSVGRSGQVTLGDLTESSVAERRTSRVKSTNIMNSAVLMIIFRGEKVVQIV